MKKHSILYPIGNGDVMCEIKGHDYKTLFVEDREYRFCRRCDCMERKEYFGFGINMWVINEIKPGIA